MPKCLWDWDKATRPGCMFCEAPSDYHRDDSEGCWIVCARCYDRLFDPFGRAVAGEGHSR